MIFIKDGAVNTHSIVSTMTSEDESNSRKHICNIHVFQNPETEPGVDPIFAVSCKALDSSDDSVVEHKFTLSLAGFENLVLAFEDLMKDHEKYKHGIDPNIEKD